MKSVISVFPISPNSIPRMSIKEWNVSVYSTKSSVNKFFTWSAQIMETKWNDLTVSICKLVDFDELLDESSFASIEKIKTIGSTYMAVSGLDPVQKTTTNVRKTSKYNLYFCFKTFVAKSPDGCKCPKCLRRETKTNICT